MSPSTWQKKFSLRRFCACSNGPTSRPYRPSRPHTPVSQLDKTITQAKNIITHRYTRQRARASSSSQPREHRPRTPPENGIHHAAHRPPRPLLAASRPVPLLQLQRRQEAELLAPRAAAAGEAPPRRGDGRARRRASRRRAGGSVRRLRVRQRESYPSSISRRRGRLCTLLFSLPTS
jgi:hypothetical protein